MSRLVCEICGSSDFLKDNGVFACQVCGCKYSVEEMRRMMAHGATEPAVTVKVDNSENVKKHLSNARRAFEKEDWEEAERYYNLVEENDPDNIEAVFYSAYSKARSALINADLYKRQAAFNVLMNCISMIGERYRSDNREENERIIFAIANDLGLMVDSDFVFSEWRNEYGTVTDSDKDETIVLFCRVLAHFEETIVEILKRDEQPYLYEALIACFATAIQRPLDQRTFDLSVTKSLIESRQFYEQALFELNSKRYWIAHPEQKRELLKSIQTLESQLLKVNEEIKSSPGMVEKFALEKRVKSMEMEKNNRLSVFERKARKEIQGKIDELKLSIEKLDCDLRESLAHLYSEKRKILTELQAKKKALINGGAPLRACVEDLEEIERELYTF